MSPSPTDTCRLSLSITEGETDYLYWVSRRNYSSDQATVSVRPDAAIHLLPSTKPQSFENFLYERQLEIVFLVQRNCAPLLRQRNNRAEPSKFHLHYELVRICCSRSKKGNREPGSHLQSAYPAVQVSGSAGCSTLNRRSVVPYSLRRSCLSQWTWHLFRHR